MKGTLIDNNRTKGLFVYAVTGTEEEIERYVESKGDKIRFVTDEGPYKGAPKYFTQFPVGKNITLKFSSEGNAFVDNSQQDLLVAVANQHSGTDLGKALATEVAKEILKNVRSGSAPIVEQPKPKTEATGASDSNNDEALDS